MTTYILKQIINTWGHVIESDGTRKFQHVEAENTMRFNEWDDVTDAIAIILAGAAGGTIKLSLKVEEEEE